MSGQPGFSLAAYIVGIREGWPESDNYRSIVSGQPRDFYALSFEGQRAALKERISLAVTPVRASATAHG